MNTLLLCCCLSGAWLVADEFRVGVSGGCPKVSGAACLTPETSGALLWCNYEERIGDGPAFA
jgi:hypothetical protein